MDLKLFFQTFPDEKSCKIFVKNQREERGVLCKKCGGVSHFWIEKKEQWQCKGCKFRTTLKSGTFMESSKLSFQTWFYAIALMNMTKKGFSAKEIQRQLQFKYYEPVWYMMHKIRRKMGDMLHGIDFVCPVFVQDTISMMEQETMTRKKKVISLYGAILKDKQKKDKLCLMRLRAIDAEDLPKVLHKRELFGLTVPPLKQKWKDRALENLMRVFDGIHHQVSGKYLQNYLDEFSFKYIQRGSHLDLFNTFIYAAFVW